MELIEMSFIGGVLIVCIAILRMLLRHKIPQITFVLLWGIVIIRLLVPYTIETRMSAYNLTPKPIQTITEGSKKVTFQNQIESFTKPSSRITNQISTWQLCWSGGMGITMLCFVLVFIRSQRKLKEALPIKENPYIDDWMKRQKLYRVLKIKCSDQVQTPLTYGIIKPVIILPKAMGCTDENKINYVLTHELLHIKRLDVLWKLVLVVALCVHWFNPLVWIMCSLFNKDLELSCDEWAIGTLGEKEKSNYARTLIELAEKPTRLMPLYNEFSKNSIEERVVSIMRFKKISKAWITFSIGMVAGIALVFATSALPTQKIKLKETTSNNTVAMQYKEEKQINKVNNQVNNIPQYNTGQSNVIVKDDQSAKEYYSEAGDVVNIINNPSTISTKVLDEIIKDYVGRTQDIGVTFNVIDYLSKDAIETVAVKYIKDSGNYGMAYSFKPYLSGEIFNKLIQKETIGASDITLAEPYKNKQNQKVNNIPQYNTGQSNVIVKDDQSAKEYYSEAGDVVNIINNPSTISTKVLDEIIKDYVGRTQDIGVTFNVIDYLSKDAIETVAVKYIKDSGDYGMAYSFKPYLSEEIFNELIKNSGYTDETTN